MWQPVPAPLFFADGGEQVVDDLISVVVGAGDQGGAAAALDQGSAAVADGCLPAQGLGFWQVGGHHVAQWRQFFEHGFGERFLRQAATGFGGQYRIENHRDTGQSFEQPGNELEDGKRTGHADLDGLIIHVVQQGVGLLLQQIDVSEPEATHVLAVLYGEAGDQGGGEAAQGLNGFNVGVNAGAPGGVVAGNHKNIGFHWRA